MKLVVKCITLFILSSSILKIDILKASTLSTPASLISVSNSYGPTNGNIIRNIRIWIRNGFRNPCKLDQPKRIMIRPKYGGDAPRSKCWWAGNCG